MNQFGNNWYRTSFTLQNVNFPRIRWNCEMMIETLERDPDLLKTLISQMNANYFLTDISTIKIVIFGITTIRNLSEKVMPNILRIRVFHFDEVIFWGFAWKRNRPVQQLDENRLHLQFLKLFTSHSGLVNIIQNNRFVAEKWSRGLCDHWSWCR